MNTFHFFSVSVFDDIKVKSPEPTASLPAGGGKGLGPTPTWGRSGGWAPRNPNVGADCGSAKRGAIRDITFDLNIIWLQNNIQHAKNQLTLPTLLLFDSFFPCSGNPVNKPISTSAEFTELKQGPFFTIIQSSKEKQHKSKAKSRITKESFTPKNY